MRARLIQVAICCLLPVQLAAQTTPPVDVGDRIRVWTSDMSKVTGRVEAMTSDTLVFQADRQTASVSIPFAALLRLEVSRGFLSRRASAWKRARWGAAIGAGGGAISLGLQHNQVQGSVGPAHAAALGAWSGCLFGGMIGALVGATRPMEKWERVR
jgi:hypothetical protein